MKILIISSCTGLKRKSACIPLTIDDLRDAENVEKKLSEYKPHNVSAFDIYLGRQHLWLTNTIKFLRKHNSEVEVKLHIVSAGFGLLSEDDMIPPYNVTFNGMRAKEIDEWSKQLCLASDVKKLVGNSNADLILGLLGNNYIRATQWESVLTIRRPIISVESGVIASKECSERLIGLKGKIVAAFLMKLHNSKEFRESITGSEFRVYREFLKDIDYIREIAFDPLAQSLFS